MATRSDVPRSSEEWRAFFQWRVAGFGRILGGLTLGFYVLANAVAMLHPTAMWSEWLAPANILVVVAGLVSVGVWFLTRARRRPTGELETMDALATIVTGTCIGLTPIWGPPVQRPELPAITGVIVYIVLRGIVIPSSGARTSVLSSITVLPAIYGAYACHAKQPPADWALPIVMYPVFVAVWAALGVVAATLASRTIFGLRKKASEAQKLGQYTLGEKIGEGGMGAVYRASHAMMKREVAIKLLPKERAGKQSLVRFEREVQLTSRLESPNTIAIYDYGRTPDGVFYYVMEYIDGFSLEDLVERFGPLPPGRVVHLAKQVCLALAEAHSIGLIHRDIKPANIALCERAGVFDVVKVFDFGLVKELGTDSEATAEATLTGTPLYLSPESITSPEKVDGRADLYAVGGVAYYLLTGTHVFDGKTVVEVCSHHLHSKPESPSVRLGARVASDLEEVILRCLEKNPESRYANAEALAHAFDACEAAEEWSDDLASAWWLANRAEADAAKPKLSVASRRPGPVEIDLAGRGLTTEEGS